MSTRPPPEPNRPYRDFVGFYTILSGVVIIVGVLTGNAVLDTIAIAAVFFVVANAYTWWRFRKRVAAERQGP